ncbi:MAG: hypothetical protein PWQ18_1436 [Clostridia bacterium]|nr:hypothetical protein [Clostridia bacterium]
MPFTAPSVANKGNRFRIGPRTDILVAVQELVVFTILQDTLMLIPTLGLQPVRPCPGPNQGLALSPKIPLPPGQPCPGPLAGLSYQPPSFFSYDWHFPGSMTAVDDCCPPAALPDSDNCCRPQALPGPGQQPAREEESPCYVELIVGKRVLDSTCRADEALLVWPYFPPDPTPGVPVKILACSIKNLKSWNRLIPVSPGGQALAIVFYTYAVEIIYADGAGQTAAVTLPSGPRHQQAVVCPGSGYLVVDVRVNCAGVMITSPVIPVPGPPPPYKPMRVWLQARPVS